MAENSVLTVRISNDIEATLQTLCEQLECDKAEATRTAIRYMADHINKPQVSDHTANLMQAIERVSLQNGEIVALLEPLHTAGGPRKLHSRAVMAWTSVDQLLTPDQRATARKNCSDIMSRYGLTMDGSDMQKEGGE